MTSRASLVLIDPRAIVREHFLSLADELRPLFRGVLAFPSVSDFVVEYHTRKWKINMLVLGVGTVMYAEESIRTIKAALKKPVATVLLDDHLKYAMIKYMMRHEIDGYLSLFNSHKDFIEIASLVLEGKRVISQEIGKIEIVRSPSGKDLFWIRTSHYFQLSNRESELFRLLVQGEELYTCSDLMGITVKSAENLKTRLMQKLNVHSTAHLILQGIKFGLGHY